MGLILYTRKSFFYLSLKAFIIIFFLYLTSYDALNSNFYLNFIETYGSLSNSLLTNSVNKIHPLLLYISLFFFINIFVIREGFYLNYVLHRSNLLIVYFFTRVKSYLVIISITLFLGSWWALQEGSWGGWWNWDPSEVFALVIVAKFIFFLHNQQCLKHTVLLRLYSQQAVLIFLFIYFLLRLDFALVSHNFGLKFFNFMDPQLVSLYFLMNIFLYLFILYKSSIKYLSSIRWALTFISTVFIIIYLILTTTYLTFLLLVENLLWTNYKVAVISYKADFNVLILIIMISISIFLLQTNATFLLIYSMGIGNNFVLTLFFKKNYFNSGRRSMLHFLLFFTTVITLFNLKTTVGLRDYLPNEAFSECIFKFSLNSTTIEYISNFAYSASSFESRTFNLVLTSSSIRQVFYPLYIDNLYSIETLEAGIIISGLFLELGAIILFHVLFRINKEV